MLKVKKLLLVLLVVFSSMGISSKLRVGSFPIPLMVIDNQNGVFVELFQEIAKRANFDYELIIAPPPRILGSFMNGDVDVFFPALDVLFPPDNQPIKTEELIYVKEDYVFTRKNSSILSSIKDLANKNVGITRGYPYVRELLDNTNIVFDFADTDETNARKLIAGRIDAFVVEEKTGLQAFDNIKGTSSMQYNKQVPLSKQDVYYAINKSHSSANQVSNKISAVIREMKKDGTFARIMSKAN
jgi:polar amino acid transport system substrate-binding protein